MGVDYAWEKFYSEIRFALVSNAPLQERLSCLISGVSHLQRESFPDEHAWDEFRKLVNGAANRQTQMSDKEAKERLHAAFDIFSQVAKALGRTEFVI
jgi:hypothetical protein